MSLSATPIPRTLQMSLTGIRDISVIETPPRGRHEIRTYIGEYRDELVRVAIEKEVARKGQVFYLHNRVETIDQAAEHVRELVPGARLLVAHGQMHERALEKVMMSFLAGDADVLVTTSIIESGIDIPTANTLVVERADMLGLAQLYQIRGRIGRSDAYAYAYLLYPSEELLTSDAAARLATLQRPHGAGRRLQDRHARPRDPRRRQPAGRRAERARRGDRLRDVRAAPGGGGRRSCAGAGAGRWRRCASTCPVTAYVPPEYIAYEATKIDVHRRIARAATLQELDEARAELTDRFGPPPEPVDALLQLQAVRLKAAQLGCSAVTYRGRRLQLDGLKLDDAAARRLRETDEAGRLLQAERAGCRASSRWRVRICLRWAGQMLDAIIRVQA